MLAKLKSVRCKNAFTLVELLVVIAIIALLVAIVVPAISGALFRGRMTTTLTNGVGIHRAIFAKQTESIYTTTSSAFPVDPADGGEFNDSNAFLNSLVTNGTLNVGYNYFTAPGLPPAPNETDFLANAGGNEGNNAWCATLNITDSSSETMPALFTRNLNIPSLAAGQAYTADAKPDNLGGSGFTSPFDDRGFVFVTKGGAGYSLYQDDLNCGSVSEPGPMRTFFVVVDEQGTDFANNVLRPAGE